MDRFFSVERLVGTRFADVLIGTDPDATPLTGNEDNELDGGAGPDRLFGVGGPDLLDGGPGVDRCRGGPGDDLVIHCET
jgi:Ca2+-binding RTX toxin-like protein